MKCRLALYGPMHVSISIQSTSLENYKSGVWDDPEQNCSSTRIIDHAVYLVGYGTEVSKTGVEMDYWIVQNSWSPFWGTNGFFKIKRGTNLCLIASDAMYPVLKTSVQKPLKPIYTPVECSVVEHVYSSSGVYIKSLCIDIYSRTYEDSRASCLQKGMQLYQLDSPEASFTVLDVGLKQWTNNFYYNELYVNGNSGTDGSNINNKEPFGPVSSVFLARCLIRWNFFKVQSRHRRLLN